jgi:hypothetical protein
MEKKKMSMNVGFNPNYARTAALPANQNRQKQIAFTALRPNLVSVLSEHARDLTQGKVATNIPSFIIKIEEMSLVEKIKGLITQSDKGLGKQILKDNIDILKYGSKEQRKILVRFTNNLNKLVFNSTK